MKRKIAFLLALLMAASILAGCGGNKTWTGKHEVEITVNNYGTIRLEVDADSAPKTASQFRQGEHDRGGRVHLQRLQQPALHDAQRHRHGARHG